jgi:pilus assembly protein CpaF
MNAQSQIRRVSLDPLSHSETSVAPIGVLDDTLSPITEHELAERQREAGKRSIKSEARMLMAAQLKRSGIGLRELDDASDDVRAQVRDMAAEVVAGLVQRGHAARGRVISETEAALLNTYLLACLFGAGELEPLFMATDVEDIIINTRRAGRRTVETEVWTFRQSGKRRESIEISADEVLELVNRSAARQGRQLSPVTPILNARMINGARINAVLDPVCDPALSVTIRVHRLIARDMDRLIALGTLTQAAAAWLTLCVRSKVSICIGGGTSSGKTNLLNALTRLIAPDERVVTIEDTRELDLAVADKVHLTTLINTDDPSRSVTQRHLVANALRMRPDRIILGEVRDGAAFDAIKACNTGHDGSLLTVHAEDAESIGKRLLQLCREAPETASMNDKVLNEQISVAFQGMVHVERRRQRDGSFKRMISQINESSGHVQHERITQQRMFELRDSGLEWTRALPCERVLHRMLDAGYSQRDIEDALSGRSTPWRDGIIGEAKHG